MRTKEARTAGDQNSFTSKMLHGPFLLPNPLCSVFSRSAVEKRGDVRLGVGSSGFLLHVEQKKVNGGFSVRYQGVAPFS